MTKSRVFFYLLLSFILGVALASLAPLSISVVWAVFVLGGAVASFGMFRPKSRPKAIVAGLAIVVSALGLFRFLHSTTSRAHLENLSSGENITFEAVIDDEPLISPRSQQIVMRGEKDSGRIMLITRPYPKYQYGDLLKVSGKIARPESSRDFDYAAYLAKDGIFYVMPFPKIEFLGHDEGSRVYGALFRIKNIFSGNLDRLFSEPQASFMGGLVLGARRSMPPELVAKMQTTGTTHLVALSGYNITIVASAFLKVLTFIYLPFSWALTLAVLGIVAFTALTGAQASVVRAAIMGILVLLARGQGRQYRMRNALALAGALMLIHNPQILRFDVGFQLSFLATIGLIYAAPLVDKYYDKAKLKIIFFLRRAGLIRDNRVRHRAAAKKSLLREVLTSTLAAQLLALPLIVWRFGKLSLVSPLANIAILPFIPLTMFLGFAAGGLEFIFDPLGRLVSFLASALMSYELAVIDFFARLPWAAVEIKVLNPLAAVFLYLLIAFWLFRGRRRLKKKETRA